MKNMKSIKKMRGVIDPISLGFILVLFGATVASTTNKSQDEVTNAPVEAPQVVANTVAKSN